MSKRIISDVTWKSKKVRSIQPPEYRPEYAWIMPVVEDNGVFEYDPDKLWSEAYALARPGWTPERVKELLDELIRVGLLLPFEAQGKTWCYLVGCDKPGHLPAPSMRNSKSPLPPSYANPRSTLGRAYDEPRTTLDQSYALPKKSFLGIGSGIGSGIGIITHCNDNALHCIDTERDSTGQEQHTHIGNELAHYLHSTIEQYNPDAIASAPKNWEALWSRDILEMLTRYSAEDVEQIITESQSNPKFRQYVVRGAGLVSMADSIHSHLNKPRAKGMPTFVENDDDEDDEEF